MDNPPKEIKKVASVAAFILSKERFDNNFKPLVISSIPFSIVLEKGFKSK